MKTEDQLFEEQIEQNKNNPISDSTMEDLMRLERKELNLIKSKGILGPTINKLLSLESCCSYKRRGRYYKFSASNKTK